MLTASQKKLLSVIIFFISYSYLLLFMYRFLGGAQLSFLPFWFAVLGILIPIVYLIRSTNLTGLTKSAIFAEIILVILLLNLFQIMLRHYQLTLAGDAYLVLVSANRIEATSHLLTSAGPTFDKYPFFQVLSLTITQISGINQYSIALFSPMLYQILATIFMYLLARELYNDRTALLACAIFAPYSLLAKINSNFRPEILAYVFLFACLFLLAKRRPPFVPLSITAVAVFFMISITLTHYTTNAIFVFFLLVMLVASAFSHLLDSQRQVGRGTPLNSGLIFAMLAIVISVAYLVFVGTGILEIFVWSVAQLSAPTSVSMQELGYVPRIAMLKDVVVLRTNAFYVLLFAGLMVYEVVKRRRCKDWHTDFSLACWAGATLILWLIGERQPQILASSRIYLFSYPFVLILVSHIVTEMGSSWKRISFIVLLIGFALLNIITIQIIPLNPLSHSPPFPLSRWDTTQEVQAANWEGAEGGAALTSGAMGSLLQYTKGLRPSSVGQSIDYFEGDIERWRKDGVGHIAFSWLYLKPDDPVFVRLAGLARVAIRLDEATLFQLSNTPWLQKVYTNEEWDIYRIAPQ